MAYLNKNINVRKAVVRICSLLREERRSKVSEGHSHISNSSHGNCEDSDSEIVNWDYFEDPEIKNALDEVLEFIRVEKLNQTGEVGPNNAKSNSDNNVNEEIPSGQEELVSNCLLTSTANLCLVYYQSHLKLIRLCKVQQVQALQFQKLDHMNMLSCLDIQMQPIQVKASTYHAYLMKRSLRSTEMDANH
jgi:general transcription factor 3C polypeptide 1